MLSEYTLSWLYQGNIAPVGNDLAQPPEHFTLTSQHVGPSSGLIAM